MHIFGRGDVLNGCIVPAHLATLALICTIEGRFIDTAATPNAMLSYMYWAAAILDY
jgi:hypothetical protein